jgi:hypothetical protein
MNLLKRVLHIFNEFVNQKFQIVILDRNLSFVYAISHVFEECNGALFVIEFHCFILDLNKKFLVLFLVLIVDLVLSFTFALNEVFDFVGESSRLYYF